MNKSHLIVVDSSVLPEVILKVLQVKKIMANKEAKSSAAACKLVGVSRSAYYKYRDCVYSYEEKLMVSLHNLSANILTVNQSIPIDGVATVTISLRLNESFEEAVAMKSIISELRGVVDIQLLSGE